MLFGEGELGSRHVNMRVLILQTHTRGTLIAAHLRCTCVHDCNQFVTTIATSFDDDGWVVIFLVVSHTRTSIKNQHFGWACARHQHHHKYHCSLIYY